jgi:hypothetical protein
MEDGVSQQHREDVLMKGTSHEQQQPLEAVPPMPIFNTTAITPNPWSAASSVSLTKGKGQASYITK